MSDVIRSIARLALVHQVVAIRGNSQGSPVVTIPHFEEWVDRVIPELSMLSLPSWKAWLETGVEVYGLEKFAFEIWNVITGRDRRPDGCAQYVRECCMPFLPDLGYLVACCCCE